MIIKSVSILASAFDSFPFNINPSLNENEDPLSD